MNIPAYCVLVDQGEPEVYPLTRFFPLGFTQGRLRGSARTHEDHCFNHVHPDLLGHNSYTETPPPIKKTYKTTYNNSTPNTIRSTAPAPPSTHISLYSTTSLSHAACSYILYDPPPIGQRERRCDSMITGAFLHCSARTACIAERVEGWCILSLIFGALIFEAGPDSMHRLPQPLYIITQLPHVRQLAVLAGCCICHRLWFWNLHGCSCIPHNYLHRLV